MSTDGLGVTDATVGIDTARWPGLAEVPTGTRARMAGAVAGALFRRAVARLPVCVEYPDGELFGGGTSGCPRMVVRDPEAFTRRVGRDGLVGFGESYMAGEWSSPDLVGVLEVFASHVATLVPAPLQRLRALYVRHQPAGERGTAGAARSNIARHYDLSNELFATFLDETLTYSSALFPAAEAPRDSRRLGCERVVRVAQPQPAPDWDDLAFAQIRKIDRLLDAAGVGPGTRVLEIGTGWGELCVRAARRGATVRSVTLSEEQRTLARRRVSEAGVQDNVVVDLLDYRSVDGEYDAIVSVEMIEAVGFDFWPAYFEVLDRVLAPGGRVALQAITMPHERMLATRNTYTWVHKYIFPGGFLPSTEAIDSVARRRTTLRVTDRLLMGGHYAETLRLWRERFDAAAGDVAGLGFDSVFRRMWHFYLGYSEAGFRSGYLDVQQIVLARGKDGS